MVFNRTLTNAPVHYTKGPAPFTVMVHILFFEFFQSWIKDRSISTNGPGPLSKILKIQKIRKILKKIEKLIFQYLKNFSRVVFYPDSGKVVSFYF